MRSRAKILLALALVIALGLATRSPKIDWPAFVAIHFGDALWTVAVYLGLALLRPSATPMHLGIYALGISFGVEFSQLFAFPWLVSLRNTTPGALLLGSGFLWMDLVRYAAGALVAVSVDTCLTQRPD